jgi:two-component system nitrate/nitrite response regulator NarL
MSETQPSVMGQRESATGTILVIDDQLLVSSALAYTLHNLGFDAHSIRADLAEVQEAASAHLPGLVLLDLDLGSAPDHHSIDGVDLIGPLRAHGWTVMVLTGIESTDRVADAIARGATSWSVKGGTFAELVRAAVQILKGHGRVLLANP